MQARLTTSVTDTCCQDRRSDRHEPWLCWRSDMIALLLLHTLLYVQYRLNDRLTDPVVASENLLTIAYDCVYISSNNKLFKPSPVYLMQWMVSQQQIKPQP